MRNLPLFPLITATVLAVSGCASDGGSHNSGDYIGPVYPASGMYYGSHDYYYHDNYPDYIVTPRPPVDVPDHSDKVPGVRPEYPMANPPGNRPGNRPSTLPAKQPSSASYQRARTPSIPMRARPSSGMRGGSMRGGRGGGGRRR